MEYQGKIIKGLGGLYEIRLTDGTHISCRAKGSFRHESEKPFIGDNVIVKSDVAPVLETILPRKNQLIRPPIANIDIVFVTFAAAEPEPDLLNIDKLTCIAEHLGIRPVLTITKADLNRTRADELTALYRACGYTVFVSGNQESAAPEIRQFLKDEGGSGVSCFAGASGVGKSTLMTAIFPELNLKTGEISTRIARGKHTTRHVELYPLCDLMDPALSGYVADTPGFSLLDFVRFDFFGKEVLPNTFPEFEPYIGHCRYTKCAHLTEEGCAICDAVKSGIIPSSRHDSYIALYRDLKNKPEWKNKSRS